MHEGHAPGTETNALMLMRRLVVVAERQDGASRGHSQRVMGYSLSIARTWGLDAMQTGHLAMGALLHDVGKVGVPERVLRHPGKLDDEARSWIERHPRLGYDLLQYLPTVRDCLPIVLCHHERLDGSGYPQGLQGDEVPLLAQIVAVADVFDAMTSPRPYRAALPSSDVIVHLQNEARKRRLDRRIVLCLADSINIAETKRQAWIPVAA
jgi:HD-GYP domain-containing protein (c-di-GMP phosphodiesterase class II)